MRKAKDFLLVIFAEILAVLLLGDCVDVDEKPKLRPYIISSMANVTVTEGETAVLICKTVNLRETDNKTIVWVKELPFVVLTHRESRVIDDERINVEHPVLDEWNLHIRSTVFSDAGRYLCILNTEPALDKHVQLNIIVPPKIEGNNTWEKMEVMENGTATLECKTSGSPKPRVEWRRVVQTEEKEKKTLSKLCPGTTKVGNDGEVLIIANITRHCGGTYQCMAINNRGSSATKDFHVEVLFAPEVTVPNPRIYHEIGRETVLDCYIMASEPIGEAKWVKDGKEVKNTNRDKVDVYRESNFMRILSLRLLMIKENHFGTYTCLAKNQIGQDSANITLYDYSKHRKVYLGTTTLTTTTKRTNLRPSYMDHSRRQQYPIEADYSREPYQEEHKNGIGDDQKLKYETGRPNYGHVSSDRRNFRNRHPSDKDGANHVSLTCTQLLVKMAAVWLIIVCLK